MIAGSRSRTARSARQQQQQQQRIIRQAEQLRSEQQRMAVAIAEVESYNAQLTAERNMLQLQNHQVQEQLAEALAVGRDLDEMVLQMGSALVREIVNHHQEEEHKVDVGVAAAAVSGPFIASKRKVESELQAPCKQHRAAAVDQGVIGLAAANAQLDDALHQVAAGSQLQPSANGQQHAAQAVATAAVSHPSSVRSE